MGKSRILAAPVPVAGVITRPMLLVPPSVNHRLPSGPFVISSSWLDLFELGYSVIAPAVVTRPMYPPGLAEFPQAAMNHKLPSAAPPVIPWGHPPAIGMGYWLIRPVVVMRPMWPLLLLVNHIAPSGPAVILIGAGLPSFEASTVMGYSVNSTDSGG